MLAHIRLENTEMGHWNELGWLGDHSLATGGEPAPSLTLVRVDAEGQTPQGGETRVRPRDDWAPW